MTRMNRRTALRGLFQGATVAVALPYLDCFLNANGTLLAAEGAPLPVRFGTWFWGLGVNPPRWFPDKVFDRPEQMEFISLHLAETVPPGTSQSGSDNSRPNPQKSA